MPARHLLLALTPTWLALAWLVSKAQWFWNNRPDLQFGWIVLLLSAYLTYEAWERKPEPKLRLNPVNLALGIAGVGLLFVVQIYQAALGTMAASIMGLTLGVMLVVAANLLYVFGWAGIRRFGFGFAFLLIALPMPSAIQNPVVSTLQSNVATINVEVLNLIGIPAQKVGSLIHLPSGTVGVDEACSGIRSLQSTVMATLFIGYLTLNRISFQAVLLVLGVMLAVLGNVIRSLFLSYTANEKGIEAIDQFHDTAGWSILAFTAVGVLVLSWIMGKVEKRINEMKTVKEEVGREGREGGTLKV